ncbi:MAG: hypothetical protein ABIR46_04110 [Candidatus Saccharimonadales bacterium]
MLAILLAVTIAIGGSNTTQALHDTTSLTNTLTSTISTVRDQTTRTTTDETTEQKRLELEARKQELEQKVTQKRAAISEKLMGARAERCMAKQDKINTMLDTRVTSAQKHFDTFKAIQDRLVLLVKENELDVENHGGLENLMDIFQTDAQASINNLGSTNFACEDADATAPGAIVKDQVSVAKKALKDYRDSIKNYAVAIKASIEQPKETPAEETESTEETTDEVQQ